MFNLGCYDGKVYTLEASSGRVMWTFATGGPVKCSPTVHPETGVIFVGSHDHCLYALDIQVQHNLFAGSWFTVMVSAKQGVIYRNKETLVLYV